MLELFPGQIACFSGSNGEPPYAQIILGMARSNSPAGPYTIQQHVFLGQHNGCGRDQPSWQWLAPYFHVIVSDPDLGGMIRYSVR
jgi:hypothetical protein